MKDMTWAANMGRAFPPGRYQLKASEMLVFWDFGNSDDFFKMLGAVYNYGFQRGQNAERNARKDKKEAAKA